MNSYRQDTKIFERIIPSIDFQELKDIPLFGDDKWYAAEEIVLLTLMEHHSYGNWSLLAEILTEEFHKKFTAEEVEEHYVSTYLEGDIAQAMRSAESNTSKSSLIDHTSKEDVEWLKSVDMNACENVPQKFLEKIGYMPLREDFEREYDSAAEDLIQNLDFSFSTDDYDKNVNLILLDTYRNRIMERIERKKAVKKFRIVEQFFAKSNPSFEKKYLEDKLLSPEPYDIPKIHEEEVTPKSKKTRSARLKQHLSRKIAEKRLTQHTDCDDEEEFVTPKDTSRTRKRRSLSSNKTTKLLMNRSDNFRLLSPEPYSISKIHEEDITPKNKKTRSARLKQHLSRKTAEKRLTQHKDCDDEEEVVNPKDTSRNRKRRSLRSNKTTKLLMNHSDNSENEAVESDKKAHLTIEDYPESEFLTRAEKRLCTDLGLKPSYYRHYIRFLTYIDLEKSEGRYPNENLIPAHMTVAQCSRIVSFLEKVGWVKNQNLLNLPDD